MKSYPFGHTDIELQRLALQSQYLRPITERLLRSAGLQPGMSVLELGCGAGDICFLAAELVGASGRVIGVDRSSAAVDRAAARAKEIGARNVSFFTSAEHDEIPGGPFDFLIGRYVLVHQDDPTAFVRRAMVNLRPGGIAAYHEPDTGGVPASRPPIPLYDDFNARYDSFRQDKLAANAGVRLVAILAEAGLKPRGGFCERPIGMEGSDLFFRWRAATSAGLAGPGHPSSEPAAVEKLAAELEAAVAAVHGQVLAPDQWCVWAQLGGARRDRRQSS